MTWLLALLAILASPHAEPPPFVAGVLGECRAVTLPGTFIGCEYTAPDGEGWYAGVVWIDGQATLNTGP